jgi:transposase
MRGTDEASGSLFSYVDLEARIPARHPLRMIRQVVNEALASLGAEFEVLCTAFGRPSIAPERLIRGEPDPDPVLRPLRAPADGADAV